MNAPARTGLQPVHVARERVHRRGTVRSPAAADRRADRPAAVHAHAPLVHGQSVGNADVTRARHGQPGIGEPPTQRRILFAVVHVPVNALAVDGLHVVGEKLGDVLVRRPIDRHAERDSRNVPRTAAFRSSGRSNQSWRNQYRFANC